MSGLFGIIDTRNPAQIPPLLEAMGQRMAHRPWYIIETTHDIERGVGLGRIAIGLFNRTPQPIYSQDGALALWLCGELYGSNIPDGSPKCEGIASNDERHAALAMALYRTAGDDFARHLEGAFLIALWDRARERLIVANDRFGLYPLYYAHHHRRLLLAPEVKGILTDPSMSKTLNMAALAEYMRFQHMLGDKTFFDGIRLFPPASTLTYELAADRLTLRPYWDLDEIPVRNVPFAEAVEEAGRLFRRAVNRLAAGPERIGVYLSGGLDSRAILGVIERGFYPIASLTYGQRGCRDVAYAERIARAVGSEHHWIDLPNSRWVQEYADFHLTLTEGFHSWIHAHGISTLERAREIMDVNLSGWDGGTVMGHEDSIEPLQCQAVSDDALTTRLFYLFNQHYTWPSLTEAEERLLYVEPLRAQLCGLAFESFRVELTPYLRYRPDVRGEYFYIRNHCLRLTQPMITFMRSHIEVRFPFFDYQLFEFLYSLPATVRGHRHLYRAMLQRECPRLTIIPYDHDDLLPTTNRLIRGAHRLIVRTRRRINRHLFGGALPERPTLYADYEAYLRGELRPWAESILFDRRTIERGIFHPGFVKTLFDRHLSGLEEWTIGKIAPIMTYEMMLRTMCDG